MPQNYYDEVYLQNPHIFNANSIGSNRYQPPNFHSYNSPKPQSKYNSNSYNQYANTNINTNHSTSFEQNPSLLQNNSVSFARNFKTRLYGVDPNQQKVKQIKQMQYREQLAKQAQADKQRKQEQKRKLIQQEQRRQKKFYEQVSIQAQQKPKKQQPSYFVMRSAKQKRKKGNSLEHSRKIQESSSNKIIKNNFIQAKIQTNKHQQNINLKIPKIMKRGGYHNQSALDHFEASKLIQKNQSNNQEQFLKRSSILSPQQMEIQIIRQRNYQEERIGKIMKFQQRMLKKLDSFKNEIFKVNHHLDLKNQVQRIKISLRAKPIRDNLVSIRDNEIFESVNQLYGLPPILKQKRENKIQHDKRNRISRQSRNRQRKLQSREQYEPNIKYNQNEEYQQNKSEVNSSQNQKNLRKQIKLFDRKGNDKNPSQNNFDEITLPVVHEQQQNPEMQSNFNG